MTEYGLLKSTERAAYSLRSLYRQYGYIPYKMNKFEEYDLYARNKDFLLGDNVITFNDTDGRLLALKPDVTLSIIKNSSPEAGCKYKVCYNENVYRVSNKFHRFKEIVQSGLECIGDTDILDTYEVIDLAAKSLALISDDFVIDISSLAILTAALEFACPDHSFKKRAAALVAEKNRHGLLALSAEYGVSADNAEMLATFVDLYGDAEAVLSRLCPIAERVGALDAYSNMCELFGMLSQSEYASRLRIDFSVVNNAKYYNGIVFKGFIRGLADGILTGGEYGTLMRRVGKESGAVGFAIYLDLLEDIAPPSRGSDVDVLIIYNEKSDTGAVLRLRDELIASGESVSLQKKIPSGLRYKKIIEVD